IIYGLCLQAVPQISPERELALKVRNRRTPSGQFFTSVNSALIDKPAPPNYYEGEDMTETAISSLRSTGPSIYSSQSTTGRHQELPKETMTTASVHSGPPVYQFSGATERRGTTAPAAPWLMPWQTGDRKKGRTLADQVRTRRTPSGNFAIMTLAKANK
ncbi:hypothetical protein CEUSTIGMA_g8749.t1, partial [Chlamydomonas eustigma]